MPPASQRQHSTKRQVVIASAEVQLYQVQVIDSTGLERTIFVWRCGPVVFYADSMDGLFDISRRKPAPDWVVKQMGDLPLERQFNSAGVPRAGKSATTPAPKHVPTDSNDVPGFAQA